MQLKRILADEYSGFSGNAVTKLVVDSTLIVDDRGTADDGAEKKLLPWFCMVVVDIKEALINSVFVTPAQAGVQKNQRITDSRLRALLSGVFHAVIPAKECHPRPDRGQESLIETS
ncbi:MAG: hypothetical protein AB7U63_01215 [Porticoccaceae bacterium]